MKRERDGGTEGRRDGGTHVTLHKRLVGLHVGSAPHHVLLLVVPAALGKGGGREGGREGGRGGGGE